LADYLIYTGQFIEPTTRAPMSLDHVVELGMVLDNAGLPHVRESLMEAHGRPDKYLAEKEKRDLVEALDRCVGEVVWGMLRLVEDEEEEEEDEDDEVRLCLLISHFSHFFSQLLEAASGREEVSLQCLDHYYRLLRLVVVKVVAEISIRH